MSRLLTQRIWKRLSSQTLAQPHDGQGRLESVSYSRFPKQYKYVFVETYSSYPLTVDLPTAISYNVTTTIEYPDLPTGNLEGDGALIDLTVLGIKGDVRTLRPSGQIDYFKQAHLFVENGIEVERL